MNVLSAALLASALLPCSAFAQTAEIPRTPSGKPDFTGMWAGPGFQHTGQENDNPTVALYNDDLMAAFQPGAKEKFVRISGDIRIDDPTAICLPNGLTRQIPSPYAQQWVQTDDQMVVLYEYMHFFRVIPIGEPNREHAPIFENTYMGDSIGWWEGDTLVIDTIGLKEWLLDAYHPDTGGTRWHSDQAHVVERIKYTDATNASYDVTIDDPGFYTAAWTQPWAMQKKQGWKLFEFICEDNNRCEAGVCKPADVQLDDGVGWAERQRSPTWELDSEAQRGNSIAKPNVGTRWLCWASLALSPTYGAPHLNGKYTSVIISLSFTPGPTFT
jgi:hypothetical protein